ncbi:MAG: methionyl-tRNA formyltransferase [Planctomycetota bacterium]
MRIVFFGSGAFGLPTLERLAAQHDVAAVITQPDRRSGRGSKTTPTPIGAFAAGFIPRTPVLKPERIRDEVAAVREIEADAWVIIAYGQKLPPDLLAGRFAINLHASLLPRWRGAAPINAAVVAGDAHTGNSVIALAERMDAGVVYAQSHRTIEPDHTAGELHDLLAGDGPDLVLSVLDQHAQDATQPVEQDESRVTIAPKMSKADGWIDVAMSATTCRQRVHGLAPWPGVTVTHRDEPLRLLRVEDRTSEVDQTPGTIVDASAGLVACGERSSLRLIEVQPAGKKPMAWRDFANGRHVETGEHIIGRTEP